MAFTNQDLAARGVVVVGADTNNFWDIIDWINQHSFGRPCYIAPGVYLAADPPHPLITSCTIIGNAGVSIISSITPVGFTNVNGVFAIDTLNTAPLTTTLSGTLTIGSNSIAVVDATNIAVGNHIAVTAVDAAYISQFEVISKVGNTLTVERPIFKPFSAGATVKVFLPPTINIFGNGMRVTGTGDRIVSIVAGFRCHVEGIVGVWTTNSEHVFSYDLGGYQCVFEECELDGQGVSATGFGLESCERSSLVRCRARRCTLQGHHIATGIFCTIDDCHASDCATGCEVSVNIGTDTSGCHGCNVIGGSFNHNQEGIQVSNSADGTHLIGVSCCFNTADGILINDITSGPAVRTYVEGAYLEGNAQGMLVRSDVRASGVRTKNNTAAGILLDRAASDLIMTDFSLFENAGPPCSVTAAGRLELAHGSMESTKAGFNDLINQQAANSSIYLRDVRGKWAAGQSGAFVEMGNVAGAVLYMQGCRSAAATNGGSFGVFTNNASNSVHLDENCDFTGASSSPLGGTGVFVVAQSGFTSKSLASADVTLTLVEGSASSLRCTGNPGAGRNLIVPTVNGMIWNVSNEFSTAQTVTVKTAAGSGIAIAQNKNAWVRCDGTNVVRVTADT